MTQRDMAARGFTLAEVLVVVAVLGLLASVVVPRIQEGPDAAKKAKLDQDVAIVNNAIDAYLAAGGPQGGLNASSVVETLKQRVVGGPAAEMTGPLGPFLDPRVTTGPTDFDWSARFETSPRPRFVVQKSRSGVVFGRGLPSPVGGPTASANPSWLWSYSPVAAGQVSKPVFEPGTIDTGTLLSTNTTVVVGLAAPVITPGSQELDVWGFPLEVSVSNPNPAGSSIVYYRVDSGSYVLWVGSPFTVAPGSTVTAVAISIDPSRYYNSPASSETYDVRPLALAVTVSAPSGVTYRQAGGALVGEAVLAPITASITLADSVNLIAGQPDSLVAKETAGSDKYIPPPYLSSALIGVRYTTDGSDPSSSATARTGSDFNGSFSSVQVELPLAVWGTNTSVVIRAVAVSSKPEWFTSSPISQGVSTLSPMPITLNVLPANPVGLPVTVLINESGPVPEGLRKLYTTNGVAPLTSATGGRPTAQAILYAAPVTAGGLPSGTYTLLAQGTGPANREQWFSSASVTRNYRIITSLPSEFVGANISGGDVNGVLRGSIFVSAPANLGIFNAGGQITGGNLYVPGLPAIEIPGSGNSSKMVVSRGQAYAENGEIPRTLVGGKEFTADGELADPQLDTRQVVDLNGATTPTNYTVKLTKSAYIEGKIYRRADAPPPPAVPTVPVGLPVYTNTLSGVFQTNIPSGVYSNRITMNSTNSVLRLGSPGTTSRYVFSGNTWNKGTVEILGAVEIYFLNGLDNKGVIFGSSNNVVVGSAAPLRINVMTNAVDLTGGGTVYASMWAGNSAMTVGNASSFYGSIYARTLTVSPGGIVDVQ